MSPTCTLNGVAQGHRMRSTIPEYLSAHERFVISSWKFWCKRCRPESIDNLMHNCLEKFNYGFPLRRNGYALFINGYVLFINGYAMSGNRYYEKIAHGFSELFALVRDCRTFYHYTWITRFGEGVGRGDGSTPHFLLVCSHCREPN